MRVSWELGWFNSLNKGYEQVLIGPVAGLLGIALFIAAMFYVLMAQVHQAVAGDFRAFFDIRFVWRLIRARLSAYVILAALIVLISLPLEILKTAPAFFGDWTESWSDAEVRNPVSLPPHALCRHVFHLVWIHSQGLCRGVHETCPLYRIHTSPLGPIPVFQLHSIELRIVSRSSPRTAVRGLHPRMNASPA